MSDVTSGEITNWHEVARALREIIRQVQDAVHEAGLTPDLLRAECSYRRLAESGSSEVTDGP